MLIIIYLPVYEIDTNNPLFSKVNFRSHWAIGVTYAELVCSTICANAPATTVHSKAMLNFPNPVALIASSKLPCLTAEIKKKFKTDQVFVSSGFLLLQS